MFSNGELNTSKSKRHEKYQRWARDRQGCPVPDLARAAVVMVTAKTSVSALIFITPGVDIYDNDLSRSTFSSISKKIVAPSSCYLVHVFSKILLIR